MSSCIKEEKCHRVVFLNPNKKPVGFNVTLPFTCIFSRKYMRSVSWRQLSFTFKNCDYLLQLSHIVPSALTKFIRLFECARVFDPVFHCSSCSNRSSTLFASYTLPALMSSRARSIPLFRCLFIVHPIFFDNVLRKERSVIGILILIFSIFAVDCIIVFPFFNLFLRQKYNKKMIPPNVWRIFSSFSVCNQVKEGHRVHWVRLIKLFMALSRMMRGRLCSGLSWRPLTRL